MNHRALMILIALLGCGSSTEAPLTEEELAPPLSEAPVRVAASLIDTTIAPAIAGEDGWNFHQRVSADFTGDGQPEQVVMTAWVEMIRGQPAWDDGQPWQVYVESAAGHRTYLYAQRLQLGTLTMRMAQADYIHLPTVVLLEQLPDRLRILEVSYPTASSAPLVEVKFERLLDARGEIAAP
jgi:hypothetical protein